MTRALIFAAIAILAFPNIASEPPTSAGAKKATTTAQRARDEVRKAREEREKASQREALQAEVAATEQTGREGRARELSASAREAINGCFASVQAGTREVDRGCSTETDIANAICEQLSADTSACTALAWSPVRSPSTRTAKAGGLRSPNAGVAAEMATVPKTPDDRLRIKVVDIAADLELGETAKTLEKLTSDLPKPRVNFSWCNPAGCVDHGKREVGATRMFVGWRFVGKDNDVMLLAELCRAQMWSGDWVVHEITVRDYPHGDAGFGTKKKGRNLSYKRSPDFFKACWVE